MRFYDSGFHTVTPRAASSRPAPVNPKGMFKKSPLTLRRVLARRQHFCVPRTSKMLPINRERRAEGKDRRRLVSSRIITPKDLTDYVGKVQSL